MKRIGFFLLVFWLFGSQIQAVTVTDFSLKKMDGDFFKLSEHLGSKIIVIDFWATWCKPCKKLLKRLNTIQKQYRGQVEVLAISIDEASAFSTVESYIKARRFEFTVLFDAENKVARLYNPTLKIPFTMVVDYQGNIVYVHTGYIPGVESEIEDKIKNILSSK